MRFSVESFRDTALESWPLILEHAAEVGLDRMERPFQPNWDAFYRIEEEGALLWVLVRTDEGAIAGYSIWYFMPSFLHQDLLIAVCDGFFLAKKYRIGYSLVKRLLAFCEQEARERGAVRAVYEVWSDSRVPKLMRRAGYLPRQETFWKPLEA